MSRGNETVFRSRSGWQQNRIVHLSPDCSHLNAGAEPVSRGVLGKHRVCQKCRGERKSQGDRSAADDRRRALKEGAPEEFGLSPTGERRR